MNRRLIASLALTPLLLAALPAQPSAAQAGAAPFTIVETGQSFARLQEAVRAIGDGDGTISIAAGRYRDCAVQEAGRIAFVAKERGTAVFQGEMCEDKATLVLRGRASHVDGLTFQGASVPDGNGAGIRMEKGNLTVSWTAFRDGQCGILSANDQQSSIEIDRSTFSGLGKHPDGNGAHALYIGEYRSLKISRSRFERGTGGHYVKTRAPRIEVTDSSFDDSAGRTTNYMIDVSVGATGLIARNTFVNGAGKENYSTMIAVNPEGETNPSAGLVVENNDASLAPGVRYTTVFVGNWGDKPVVRNNRLGPGIKAVEVR
jgi:hypothetical protein